MYYVMPMFGEPKGKKEGFVCKKSLKANHLTISRRRIRIILTEFLSGEHGRPGTYMTKKLRTIKCLQVSICVQNLKSSILIKSWPNQRLI